MMDTNDLFIPEWRRPIRMPESAPLAHADPIYGLAGEKGTWKLIFPIDTNVASNEKLQLQLWGGRNNKSSMIDPQVDAPSDDGFLSASVGEIKCEMESTDGTGTFAIELPDAGLKKGDELEVLMGDTSGGGDGIRLNSVRIPNKFFVLHRVPCDERTGVWNEENQHLIISVCTMHVLGGEVDRIRAFAPSQVVPGDEFSILVRPEDEYGNVSCVPLGEVNVSLDGESLEVECEQVKGSTCLSVRTQVPLDGVHRLKVQDEAGEWQAVTNPIVCRAALPAGRTYWGMIHGHTEMSDGTGSLDRYFHQLRNEARLDFGAPGDHDHLWETSDDLWAVTCQKVKEWNEPGRFVTLLGYEWAKWRKNGDGDRNVYFLEDDRPLYRSDEGEHPHPPDLFEALEEETATVIPHHPAHAGNFCDWKDHDPELEKLVEIYQIRGSYECSEEEGNPLPEEGDQEPFSDGFVRRALAMGWRVGFTGGGDDHSGGAGTGRNHDGLMAVFADELTRESVWEAMQKRRVVASSGPRILLTYRLNGHFMGSELDSADSPVLEDRRELRISFHGTAPARKIDVIRNNEVIQSWSPGELESELVWEDESPLRQALMPPAEFCENPFCFYYVRALQEDGEMVWASPVWIDCYF
ncbi:MAG: DUF3604 domain-containing protein [Candidatus Brocadiia bacterium]